ncbi:phage/plasmid primase, P4 family [Vagococcus fluvialis]|uniref:DNA primase family protein n=1 Tax=Vagococcus fluvialis TaxID=2738 RepID=UPI0037890CE1
MKNISDETKAFIKENQDLLNLQKEKEPDWIYYKENGDSKVLPNKLGYAIMKEIPIIRTGSLTYGARFQIDKGIWRVDDLNDFLDAYITEKLESVGKWSTKTLSDVKRFIMIKSYDTTTKDNPFNNSSPNLVSFQNGTYNFKTDKLEKHDPENYIFQSHQYPINVEDTKRPVKTLDWLKDLTGDEMSARHLSEMIGYCFYRSYEPFQAIFILHGKGKNGKSVFINHVIKMLNDENVSTVNLSDLGNKQNRFATSQLFAKNANLFADIEESFISQTGLIKSLTGGDYLMAERKGKDGFNFKNFAKLIFSANNLPTWSDVSSGWLRRLNVIPFTKVIDDDFIRKHDLKAIEEEIPVFTLYCMRIFYEALKRKEFTVSEPMVKAKEEWIKDIDHISRFIEECCEIDKESKTGESSKKIYDKYVDFCFDENLKALSQPKFTKDLEKYGIYKKKQSVSGIRVWRYIGLVLQEEII